MNEIQRQLNALYLDYLNKLTSDIELVKMLEIERICPPVLLDVNTPFGQFLDAELKILYVGKENNGWMSKENREYYGLNDNFTETNVFLNALIELYNDFNLGHSIKKKPYRSTFFTFMDLLLDEFRNKNIKTGILWSNLIRLDCIRKDKKNKERNKQLTKESNYLRNRIMSLDGNKILREEIAILRPDLVVFVTGPNYDSFLQRSFPDLKNIQVGHFAKREVSILDHDALPQPSLRVYHPDAYKYRGLKYKKMLSETIYDCYINKR